MVLTSVPRNSLPTSSYVAKRFYEIGKGPSIVSCTENANYLALEAERLAVGQTYLDAFYKLANDREAEVARGKLSTSHSMS